MIMPPTPTPDQQRISVRLAEFIAERHERILAEWEDAVGRDQTLPAPDKLTHKQLRDHTPQILSGLTRRFPTPSTHNLCSTPLMKRPPTGICAGKRDTMLLRYFARSAIFAPGLSTTLRNSRSRLLLSLALFHSLRW